MTSSTPANSDSALQHAIEAGDYLQVVSLYAGAATQAESNGNDDEACFFLTQAWVLSLQHDLPIADNLRKRLAAYGRI